MRARDINSITVSYIYEEDDPKRVPNKKLGELALDKQVFASREDTNEVKVKNQILREAYFNGTEGHITNFENHRVIELVFDEDFEDKRKIEK